MCVCVCFTWQNEHEQFLYACVRVRAFYVSQINASYSSVINRVKNTLGTSGLRNDTSSSCNKLLSINVSHDNYRALDHQRQEPKE